MARAAVIDQLIVKLGLDPKDFTKGEKEVAASVLRTKENVRKGAKSMSDSMEDAATSFGQSGGVIAKVFSKGGAIGVAFAIAIAAGKKVNDMLYDVAVNTRRIGIDSKNYKIAAGGLRNMQNAAELAGGSVDDATQSVGGLQKSLFDLRFNGQVSESLIMLGRLGVQFQDASGKARDFKAITLDTASALERMQASGQMSSSDAFFAAQQAGFTGGMANLVVQGRAAVEAELARQEARRQVNPQDVGRATDRVRAFESLGQAGLAEIGVPAMAAESPTLTKLSQTTERGLTAGSRGAASFIGKAAEALDDLTDSAKEAAKSISRTFSSGRNFRGAVYKPLISMAASKHGVRADVLEGIARTESSFDSNAKARNERGEITGQGLMGLNPKFHKVGDTTQDINTAAAHLRKLLDSFEGTEQERYIHALRAYHAGETNYRQGTNLGPVNEAYAGKVLSGTSLDVAREASGDTNVTINRVDIRTQATNADGIASDFADATRRKFLAAQADTGVN